MGSQKRDDKFIGFIGKKLKELRREKGVSQIEVYIDTNINVKRIEAGTQNISVSTLRALCLYYGIPLEEFFKGQ
ncbi:MAG: helix-turn-helix domain-containing protein [Rikenellaceae bacterium]|nr:helix-turn-helix domain-containing protein [Rikenellaceae bacterium]